MCVDLQGKARVPSFFLKKKKTKAYDALSFDKDFVHF